MELRKACPELAEDFDDRVGRIRSAIAGELPLTSLGERLISAGADWTATAPDCTSWNLRWFRDGRSLIATTGTPRRVGFRAKVSDIQTARQQAVRIAGLIADGITAEEQR